jgi:hypothetical protein
MSKSKRTYRVEFIALGVLVVGMVLLLDWTPIVTVVDRVIVGVAQQLTLPTLIGIVLVAGAGAFIGWRGRVRFLSSPYWRATTCPRCDSPIHRVHRSLLDKAAGKVFLPHARRYRCEKPNCGWTGLRHSRRHGNEQ